MKLKSIQMILALALMQAGPAVAGVALLLQQPYGGCRLHIDADGAARMYYGAAPWSVSVPPGTFDGRQIVARLRQARVAPPRGMPAPDTFGDFQIEGQDEQEWFEAPDYARALFARAARLHLSGDEYDFLSGQSLSGPPGPVIATCGQARPTPKEPGEP